MVINTNMAAQVSANNLLNSQALLSKSLNRLSSGSKITSPADDAAGLAVASRLNAQVQRISAASSNVGNAVSFTQTQDGYLSKIGKALAALHRCPEQAWTLDGLAEEAGVSRSTLTERFSRLLGQAPMAYLGDWRLELAAETLRNTSRSVLQVAGEVGYDSEAAFNRAFKRKFSLPPARYRKAWRDSALEPQLTPAQSPPS